MRVPIDPAVEEAPPPPYTAYETDAAVTPDYVSPESAAAGSLPVRTSLRGGYTRRLPSQKSEDSHLLSPVAYFEERHFRRDTASEELDILEHNIHFDAGTTPTRLPFPYPSDIYLRRDVVGQDWATFVNYLFPIETGETRVGSDEKRLNASRLDLSKRREKIQAVIAEWNVGFFAPRFIRIMAHFEPLSNDGAPSSALAPASRYGDEQSRNFSQCQETRNPRPSAPAYDFPPTSFAGPSQAGPSSLDSLPNRRRSGSKSSISSSSSSSSASSVDSIASRDFDHATLPEIQAIIATFRADPHKKNHIRKSVKELCTQLRSQHLPFSSSDPYNTKFSKDEKKKFKEQRKILKKDIKAIIKETIDESKAEKKFRRVARRNRHDARKQERRELKQAQKYEKHCRRDETRTNRSQECGNGREVRQHNLQDSHLQGPRHQEPHLQGRQPSRSLFPGNPQVALPMLTTRWSSERIAAVRTRSNDAAASARLKADQARQYAAEVTAATVESARQTGLQARDMASQGSRRASNTAADAAAKAQDGAFGTSRWVSSQAGRATVVARR